MARPLVESYQDLLMELVREDVASAELSAK